MAELETRVDKLEDKVVVLDNKVDALTANVTAFVQEMKDFKDEMKDFKDEMRQQNEMRAAEIQNRDNQRAAELVEIRQSVQSIQASGRNQTIATFLGVGAMVISVGAMVVAILLK